MRIRDAGINDAKNLAVLATQVWLDTYAIEGIRTSLSNYVLHELTPAKFERILQQPYSRIWVAEQRHHLVGFVELDLQPVSLPDQTGAEIVRLYIQQPFQRQGIGKQLLQQVEQCCKAQQIATVWLSAWAQNQSAIAFYQKRGFTCTGTIDFELEQERYGNLVLVKWIDQ